MSPLIRCATCGVEYRNGSADVLLRWDKETHSMQPPPDDGSTTWFPRCKCKPEKPEIVNSGREAEQRSKW